MFGVFIDMLVIMIIVGFEWEVDFIMIGLIFVVYVFFGIIFGLWVGVIVDCFRKILIMMFCNLMVGLIIIVFLFV